MPRKVIDQNLKKFEDLLNDGIIKTTGTLFKADKKGGKVYYAKFDGAEEFYTAVYNENNVLVKKDKFTTLSGLTMHMLNTFKEKKRETASGMDELNYSDNEEYYDSIVLKNLRKAAYEEVITPSSL